MPERARQILNRARDFFKNMKKGLKIGLIAGGAAIVVLIAALVIFNATRPYEILFAGLSSDDMTAVVSTLNAAGVTDVKIRNNDTVMVRENQADRLRALVIQQGYPTTGYSHATYFDNVGPLSSQADREELARLDSQDYLAATIKCFDGVQDANVVITPRENHRYILDEDTTEAKASVFVQMQSGKTLTSDQVAAIQRWVASAVQGLTISQVTVEDGSGSRYTSGNDTASELDDTMKYKLGIEAKVNEQIRNSVMSVLVPFCGPDNLEVSVHSTVDVSKTYMEQLVYHEPDWVVIDENGGHGIIGSQVWDNSLVRGGDTAAGGVVGTSTNTEINEYVTQQGQVRGDEIEIYNSGETRYNVSQDTIQTERSPGTITDLTMTIAVNSAKVNVQHPEVFINAAAMAAGIDSEDASRKIAFVSYAFYQDNVESNTPTGEITMIFGLPAWAIYAAVAGMALFLALLLVILLLRSKKKKKIAILLRQEEEAAAAAEAAAAEAAALAAAQGADIMDVHTEESMKMRQDVRQFVEENPSIAAQMIKNWLRGGEEV